MTAKRPKKRKTSKGEVHAQFIVDFANELARDFATAMGNFATDRGYHINFDFNKTKNTKDN